jgi:hypothetical protein
MNLSLFKPTPLLHASPATLAHALALALTLTDPPSGNDVDNHPAPFPTGNIPAAAFHALVHQAAALLRDGVAAALADPAAANNRSRAVAVLGSAGIGWGVNVLPFLRRSVEGRALHATSLEIRVAARRTRWAIEVRVAALYVAVVVRCFFIVYCVLCFFVSA